MVVATSSKNVICKFVDVNKSFIKGKSTAAVLFNIDFAIPSGSFTILHGPSGSGKTTILNTLIGLEPPTSGKVYIHDTELYKMSADDRARFRANTIGMMHQNNYWVNSLSVEENVALPLVLAGWQKRKALIMARQSIVRVGLEKFNKYNPALLSGGQQQGISFARATVIKPRILVADEPTGNLDSKSGERLVSLLQQFNKEYGSTIVMVTHNDHLLDLGTYDIALQDGRVVAVQHKKNTKSDTITVGAEPV